VFFLKLIIGFVLDTLVFRLAAKEVVSVHIRFAVHAMSRRWFCFFRSASADYYTAAAAAFTGWFRHYSG
jgi:hypothetical protein